MATTTSSKSTTSGVVLDALMVVLAVLILATETSTVQASYTGPTTVAPQIVNMTFVNELDAPLKVTLTPPPLGTTKTTTIAARKEGMLQVEVQGPLLRAGINFEVRKCVYFTAGSEQSRAVVNSGAVVFYVTGHCGTGVPGLQYVSTVAGACTNLGCAAPVNPNCTCPIS